MKYVPTATVFVFSALLLSLSSLAAEPAVNEMATIVTESVLPSECLATVLLDRIDGVKQFVPGKGFPIEAGVHSINGQVILDMTRCQSIDTYPEISRTADLEVNFEAGKTYYIAYDRSAPNPAEWNLLVWKVEEPGLPEEQYRQ